MSDYPSYGAGAAPNDRAATVAPTDTTTPLLAWIGYICLGAGFVTLWSAWLATAVIGYVKRDDAQSTIYHSHFAWQLRTFWLGLLWAAVGWVCAITIIGIVLAIPIWFFTALWAIYRILRGMLNLAEGRPMPYY